MYRYTGTRYIRGNPKQRASDVPSERIRLGRGHTLRPSGETKFVRDTYESDDILAQKIEEYYDIKQGEHENVTEYHDPETAPKRDPAEDARCSNGNAGIAGTHDIPPGPAISLL